MRQPLRCSAYVLLLSLSISSCSWISGVENWANETLPTYKGRKCGGGWCDESDWEKNKNRASGMPQGTAPYAQRYSPGGGYSAASNTPGGYAPPPVDGGIGFQPGMPGLPPGAVPPAQPRFASPDGTPQAPLADGYPGNYTEEDRPPMPPAPPWPGNQGH